MSKHLFCCDVNESGSPNDVNVGLVETTTQ